MSNVSKEIAIELVEDGQAGNGIVSVTRTYGISASGTTASDTTSPSDITTWSAGSPTVTTAKPYLWVKEITVYTETPDTTKYYCVGKRGDNGVDAKDVEWAYIRTTTPTAPTILNDNTYTDSNSKTYTADGHLPRVDSTNRTDIEKENSGSSSKYYECTDDPKGVNDTWKYEWEIKRTKGNVGSDGSTRTWNYYTGTMTLHNNYAESAYIIDIDNDNDQFGTDSDSKVLVEQTRSTTVTLYDGATPQTLKSLTVALKYENGTTNVPTSVATYTADKDTGKVDVTVKVNNTSNSHTEIQAHITATDTNDRQKTIVFALYKVMGGAPGLTPIIYNVAATDKVFSFQRTDANALTPSSRTSQINVARTEGNTTTILDQPQTGLTFSWGFDDESTAQASSQSIGDSIEITSTDATSHSSVWVELSTGDRETLAIVKDGAKGNSGTSVEAQYAPNSSPTSSQIHTTFQNGDKYMRTRSGSGSWSGWQKIVGENGAETDFTFNISKNKTSTNASTAPANCYYSEWQDAPIAVTTTYPYLWAKVVQKDGDGTTQSTRYIRLTGEDGKSVLAQYSVDGSSNWHTTFATGDEWMRTSDNGGTSWSAAMKIVGEDGDSTNFEFGISQYQTANGAPSDISTWSDAPIATTSSKPYLWSKVTTPDGTVSYIRLTGEKGASITKSSEVNTYKVSDSGTTTPTGTWYSTKAAANSAYAWSANRYMWTKTVITWSDTSTTTLYSAERNPDDGDAGMSIVIASQSVTYSKQTSGNLDPTTLTYGSYPSSLSKGDWLYSKTTVNYETSEGASAGSTDTYSVSYIGTDGVGRGITRVDEYYLAGNSSTTPPTGTWVTNPNNAGWSTTNKYLWNYEDVVYTDSTSAPTDKSVVAVWTEDGAGIDSITNYYLATSASSGVTTSTSGWTTSVQTMDETNCYLWNYERITYTQGKSATTTTPHIIGHYGRDGEGIASANVWYALSTSSSTAPSDSSFTYDSFPTTLNSGYYVWEATKVTYTDDSSEFTGKMCLGATSEFLAGTEVYATSTSSSTTPTSWSTTYTKTKGYYLWTATRVQYTNGTYAYLNPKCVGYWGEDGTSPYVADIDNEMDAVSVDKFGKIPQLSLTEGSITYAAKVQTTAKLFKGSAPQSFTLKVYDEGGTEYTNNGSYRNGIKVVYTSGSQTSNLIKVYFQSGASVGDKKVFTITLNSTYNVQFTVKGVQGDVYQLLPNIDEVVFGVDNTTNQWTPPNIGVYCGYTKNVGGIITEYAGNVIANTWKSGGAPYNIFYRYQNADSSWTSFYWNKDLTNGTISVANNTPYTAIQFILTSATGTGSITEDKILDRETIQIIKSGKRGDNGTSPYIADLDNEMDSVACDKNGKVKTSTTCGTNVSLFYGSSKRSCKITGITKNGTSTMGTGVTVKIDDSTPSYPTSASQTHTVSVTYATTATISSKDDFAITLQDATDTSITRVLHFTINGVREGANGEPAIIFRLNPNVNEIVKKKNGTYIPAKTSKVTCAVLKTTGSETSEEPIDETDDYVAKYKLNGTGSEVAFPTNGITVSDITSKLEIMLYDANEEVLLDRETIPLVEDGDKGDNSIRLAIDNEHEDFIYSESGKVAPAGDAESQARLYDGAVQVQASSVGWAFSFDGSTYNGVTTSYIEDALGVAKISSSGLLSVKEIGSDSVSIKVRARYPNNNSGNYYYAEFTANKTQQDKYDIIVTPNAIACNPSSYSTQTLNISATVTNLQGEQSAATIDTSSTITTGLRVWYAWVNANGSIGSLTSLNAPSLSVELGDCTSNAGVYFELRLYRGGSLPYLVKDHETVEFAKSQNGISPTIYMLDSSVSYITIPSDSSSATLSATVTAYQKEGTASKTTYSGAYLYLFTRTSSSVTVVDSSNSKRSSITISSRSVQRTLVSVGVVMLSSYKAASGVVTDINNGAYMAIVEIPVLANGNTGGTGANAIYLDLDNENDAIQYMGGTNLTVSVTSQARLYGATETISIDRSRSTIGEDYCTISNSGLITVYDVMNSNDQNILSGIVVVKATVNQVDYFATFTVQRLDNGQPKYWLKIDTPAVVGNISNDTASVTVNVQVWRTAINTTTNMLEDTQVSSLSTYDRKLWRQTNSGTPSNATASYVNGVYAHTIDLKTISDSTLSYTYYVTNSISSWSSTDKIIYDKETVPVTKVQNGQQGEKGEVARQPYEWGKWSDFIANNSNTFTVNKYESPFFTKEEEVTSNNVKSIKETKWLWVGDDGEYVPPSATPATGQTKSTTPSSSDSNWEQMVTDFKYIINEATISNYAKFGSGIFDGDYAFSQYGRVDGQTEDVMRYQNFRPEFFKGTPYTLLGSNKNIGSAYPTATPYEFGRLFLEAGVTYTITFMVGASWSSYIHFCVRKVSSGVDIANFSGQGGSSGSVITKTILFNTASSSGEYSFQAYTTNTSYTLTFRSIKISANKAFRPNLYIDWLHGEIYAQLGRFVNVTVEGVMNNLIQEVTSTNISNFGSYGGGVLELNPLKVGNLLRFSVSAEIYLPCAFYGDNENITGYQHDFCGLTTLDELRQCVGKKIHIFPANSQSVTLEFNSGIERTSAYGGNYGMLVETSITNEIPTGTSSVAQTITKSRVFQHKRSDQTNNHYMTILECKMGIFNGNECIYWEIRDGNVLDYTGN